MQTRRSLASALVIVSAVLTFSAQAVAQNSRSYISGASTANDMNACTRDAPCLTFTRALSQTIAGGIISCVDPSNYGAVPITQAVTIDCAEGFAVVGAVTINVTPGSAPVTNKSVILRGLTLQGVVGIAVGIDITAAPSVTIENVRISDFTVQGILDHRTGSGDQLFITNSTIANIGGGGVVGLGGVAIAIGGGAAKSVVLDNVTVVRNAYGLAVAAGNNVTVNRSVFSGSVVAGVEGDPGSQISVDGSRISHNGFGVQSNSSIRLSNSDISFNSTAISGNTGSFGNNRLSGNSAAGTAPTPLGGASSDVAQQ
jgi:hypothetical protein